MITKEKLESLYNKGLSMQEISIQTGSSYKTIVYRMEKYNISRRNRSEATYVKRNPNGDPFRIKKKLNSKETELKFLGLGLYWGEGDKSKNNTSVRLSNTDPQLVKKFREFLIKICRVKEEKIFYSLILFNDANEKEAIKFWTQHLKIKRNQLGKIIRIPPQGKGTYREKNKTGVLVIGITNKKLKEKVFEMINGIQ
jgi:hypothetical protein